MLSKVTLQRNYKATEEVGYTSETGTPTKKKSVVEKMALAFESDFSEMEDALLDKQ